MARSPLVPPLGGRLSRAGRRARGALRRHPEPGVGHGRRGAPARDLGRAPRRRPLVLSLGFPCALLAACAARVRRLRADFDEFSAPVPVPGRTLARVGLAVDLALLLGPNALWGPLALVLVRSAPRGPPVGRPGGPAPIWVGITCAGAISTTFTGRALEFVLVRPVSLARLVGVPVVLVGLVALGLPGLPWRRVERRGAMARRGPYREVTVASVVLGGGGVLYCLTALTSPVLPSAKAPATRPQSLPVGNMFSPHLRVHQPVRAGRAGLRRDSRPLPRDSRRCRLSSWKRESPRSWRKRFRCP